jgi:TPR repeat protein
VAFPIRVGQAPRNSFARVRGLPRTAALSEGHSIGAGAWAVPLDALPTLTITLPSMEAGRADVQVSLVAADGSVLAETRCVLDIAAVAVPAPAPTPGPAPGPAASPDDRKRALQLLQKGNELLAQGLVAPARQIYERAAELGLAQAAMALGATYDAAELDKPHLRNVLPDAAEAKRWYERARTMGAADAATRLQRLGAR